MKQIAGMADKKVGPFVPSGTQGPFRADGAFRPRRREHGRQAGPYLPLRGKDAEIPIGAQPRLMWPPAQPSSSDRDACGLLALVIQCVSVQRPSRPDLRKLHSEKLHPVGRRRPRMVGGYPSVLGIFPVLVSVRQVLDSFESVVIRLVQWRFPGGQDVDRREPRPL